MKFTCVENEFALVPAGENVPLTIASIEGKPKANPTVIEVVFKHENGGRITNNYDLVKKNKPDDKYALGKFLFSVLARAALGANVKDIDTDEMLGKMVSCEVEHTVSSKGNTFANIKRVNPWVESNDNEEDDL